MVNPSEEDSGLASLKEELLQPPLVVSEELDYPVQEISDSPAPTDIDRFSKAFAVV